MKKYKINDLSYYDGKEGRPAYIAYEGKIYDVSLSFLWKGGRPVNSNFKFLIIRKIKFPDLYKKLFEK